MRSESNCPLAERLTPQIVQQTDWSAAEMNSHSDTSRHESSAMSQHHPGRAKLRRRPLQASASSGSRLRCSFLHSALGSQPAVVRRARPRPRPHQPPRRKPAPQPASPVTPDRAGGPTPGRRTPRADRSARSRGCRRRALPCRRRQVRRSPSRRARRRSMTRARTASAASAVTKGKTVLVLGKVDSTTITASQVIVQPTINLSKASANVSSFKRGTQSASKTAGQIPTDYKEGSGTIVSGTAATKATETALTSYAGGIVDRVVRLSNGEYEVHYDRRQLAPSHLRHQPVQGGRRQR